MFSSDPEIVNLGTRLISLALQLRPRQPKFLELAAVLDARRRVLDERSRCITDIADLAALQDGDGVRSVSCEHPLIGIVSEFASDADACRLEAARLRNIDPNRPIATGGHVESD